MKCKIPYEQLPGSYNETGSLTLFYVDISVVYYTGKVLVDTSVWIAFFTGKDPSQADLVGTLLKSGRAVYTGIIALELINGAKGQKELQILHDAFDAMQSVPINETTDLSAGKLGYEVASKGYTLSTVDLLIAQTAIENSVSLMTYDKHFSIIAKQSRLMLYA